MKRSTKHRTVVVERKDEHITKDSNDKPIKRVVETFQYVYEDNGDGPSEEEIGKIYGPKASKVEEELYYPTKDGQWTKVA